MSGAVAGVREDEGGSEQVERVEARMLGETIG